jgi:phosphohistidine phosphatase
MLSLILFRHGKSDWDAPYASDHERPLAPRGRDASRMMGRLLSHTHQVPELAVSSSALRARDSLHIAARAGRWHCPMRIESALYESSAAEVLNWVRRLEENPGSLLLTGHEPTWSDLAGRLIGGAALRVPTGAMLRIDIDIERWGALAFGRGELRWLLPAKLAIKTKNCK